MRAARPMVSMMGKRKRTRLVLSRSYLSLAVLSAALFGVCSTQPAIAQTDGEPASDIQVHGFASQGYIKTTKNNYLADTNGAGSLEFSEVGINFTKSVSENLRVGMQLFARDLGPLGNYDAKFDWFYLDYRFWDWLGLRAGRTKLPFGLYNETSDIDAARVPVLLPQSVYPTQSRDYLLAQTGAELYGYLPIGAVGALEYRLYGGTIFLDTSGSDEIDEFNVPYMVGGRLMWHTPVDGLQLGGSLQALRLDGVFTPSPETLARLEANGREVPDDFSGSVNFRIPALLWVGSAEYTFGDLLVASEYSRWHVGLESDVPQLYPESTTVSERFYVMASYQVAPWFTPGAYYAGLYPNRTDRNGRDAYLHDVAVTTRYDLTSNWLFKLEGHYMRGTASLSAAMNDNTPRGALPTNWGMFLAKLTAYF